MLLCLLVKLLAIYFTANSPRKLTDESIPTIFPHKEKKKEERKNETPALVFSCKFCEFFKNAFFLKAFDDEGNETKLLHITYQLNNYCLWMIRYELFLESAKWLAYVMASLACSRALRAPCLACFTCSSAWCAWHASKNGVLGALLKTTCLMWFIEWRAWHAS